MRSGIKWSKDKDTGRINKKYAPRLKLTLPVYDDGMAFKAYLDNQDNPITDIDELVKVASGKCDIVAIVKCDKVTFNGGKYGYKWTVQQLKVYSSSSGMSGYSFIEDSDDDGDNDDANDSSPSNIVQDSESDEVDNAENDDDSNNEDELDDPASDEEEEIVEPPPPAPKPKRTVVRRKKNTSNK